MSLVRRPRKNTPVSWRVVYDGFDVAAPPGEVAFAGVTGNSRTVQPGDLYCGLPGATVHGATFARGAQDAGAVGVLTDAAGARVCAEAGVTVPVAVVDDPRAVTAVAAARVYHDPVSRLVSFGVTGTNGKTTTTFLMDAALRHAGLSTGLVGTVTTRVGDEEEPSVRTTPESWDLHALFASMVEAGVTHASIEVSSHALALHRVGGVRVSVAGFTNLSQDHLDFHPSMEHYFSTKAELFTPERAGRGVVWLGDDAAAQLQVRSGVPTETLGLAGSGAQWIVRDVRLGLGSSQFTLAGPAGQQVDAVSPLPGDFNVANSALAVVMLHATGMPLEQAATGVASCTGVPGRMERVSGGEASPLGLVDYAHTPEAVAEAGRTVRAVTPGRLVIVVGAGGDRDPEKRPGMGRSAAEIADVVIVTDDNPRSEEPSLIRDQVSRGAQAAARAECRNVGDRADAIREAVAELRGPGDTVLIAGKGHEQGQNVGGVIHPFDDRHELARALQAAGFDIAEAYR